MGSLLAGKFATMWEINVQAGREHPVLFSIYLAVLLAFAAAAIVLIWRRQARGAFWCAVIAILGGFFFSPTDGNLRIDSTATAISGMLQYLLSGAAN